MQTRTLIAALFAFGGGILMAEDWPRISGPHSNWTCNDKGLADSWPKEGPKTVWAATNQGGGFGSPVVAGGKVFLIGRPLSESLKDKNGNFNYRDWSVAQLAPGPDVLTCLDRSNGKILWKHEFNSTTNPAPTAWNTPTVDGDLVYARGGDGQVRCISVKDGKSVWVWPKEGEAPFADKSKALCSGIPTTACVTLCDDLMIMLAHKGGKQSILVALNKKTGAKVWEQPFSDWMHSACNYCVVEAAGEKLLVTPNVILKVKTGEKYSDAPNRADTFTGTYYDSVCFCNNQEKSRYYATQPNPANPKHSAVVALDMDPKAPGGTVQKWLWAPTDKDNERYWGKSFGNEIVKDGYMFVFIGSKGRGMALYCVDATTGKDAWPKSETPPALMFSCLLWDDGKLFYLTDNGTLVMVAADPKAYRLLGTAQVVGRTYSSLAISDGFAFARDEFGQLKCLDLRAGK